MSFRKTKKEDSDFVVYKENPWEVAESEANKLFAEAIVAFKNSTIGLKAYSEGWMSRVIPYVCTSALYQARLIARCSSLPYDRHVYNWDYDTSKIKSRLWWFLKTNNEQADKGYIEIIFPAEFLEFASKHEQATMD